jgi:hypothetical protein
VEKLVINILKLLPPMKRDPLLAQAAAAGRCHGCRALLGTWARWVLGHYACRRPFCKWRGCR